jgi:hypothetical protein
MESIRVFMAMWVTEKVPKILSAKRISLWHRRFRFTFAFADEISFLSVESPFSP